VVKRHCFHCAQTAGPICEERHLQVPVCEETVLLTRTVDSLVRVTRRAVDTGHDDQSQSGQRFGSPHIDNRTQGGLFRKNPHEEDQGFPKARTQASNRRWAATSASLRPPPKRGCRMRYKLLPQVQAMQVDTAPGCRRHIRRGFESLQARKLPRRVDQRRSGRVPRL